MSELSDDYLITNVLPMRNRIASVLSLACLQLISARL